MFCMVIHVVSKYYVTVDEDISHCRVLAKKWKRGATLVYAMPFPFDVVKGMQLNHRCFCVSTVEMWLAKTLCW